MRLLAFQPWHTPAQRPYCGSLVATALVALFSGGCALGQVRTPGDVADAGSSLDARTDARDASTATDVRRTDAPMLMDAPAPRETGVVDAGPPTCGLPDLVVNEVQTAGTGGAGDEFVEIYNRGNCPVDLENWALGYASATGTTVTAKWVGAAGDSIAAHGYVVIAGPAYAGSSLGPLAGGTSGTLGGSGGGIGLFDDTITYVDSVGWGATSTNELVNNAPIAAPASGQSISRVPNGQDTDDDQTDFSITATPTPGAANR